MRIRPTNVVAAIAVVAAACTSTDVAPDGGSAQAAVPADPTNEGDIEAEPAGGAPFDPDLCGDLDTFLTFEDFLESEVERLAAVDALAGAYPEATFADWGTAWEGLYGAERQGQAFAWDVLWAYMTTTTPLVGEPIAPAVADDAREQCGLTERSYEMLAVAVDGAPPQTAFDAGQPSVDYLASEFLHADLDEFAAGEADPDTMRTPEENCVSAFEERGWSAPNPMFPLGVGVFGWYLVCIPDHEDVVNALMLFAGEFEEQGFVEFASGLPVDEIEQVPPDLALDLFDRDWAGAFRVHDADRNLSVVSFIAPPMGEETPLRPDSRFELLVEGL